MHILSHCRPCLAGGIFQFPTFQMRPTADEEAKIIIDKWGICHPAYWPFSFPDITCHVMLGSLSTGGKQKTASVPSILLVDVVCRYRSHPLPPSGSPVMRTIWFLQAPNVVSHTRPDPAIVGDIWASRCWSISTELWAFSDSAQFESESNQFLERIWLGVVEGCARGRRR